MGGSHKERHSLVGSHLLTETTSAISLLSPSVIQIDTFYSEFQIHKLGSFKILADGILVVFYIRKEVKLWPSTAMSSSKSCILGAQFFFQPCFILPIGRDVGRAAAGSYLQWSLSWDPLLLVFIVL